MVRSPYRRQRRSRSSSSSGSSGDRGSKRLRQSPHANRRSSRDRASETGRRRSRSRDSSRRRSRSRDRSRRRSRSPDRGRRRSRSRESSRKRDRSYSPPPVRPIISEEPKYLNARVFVGHLASDRVTKEELESHFKIYGNILDCYVHPKGYGFVQFINEDEARIAAAKENRSLLKGSRIDTRMAAEGRRDRAPNRERDPRDRDYPPRDFREGLRDDMRDPFRDPMRDPMLDPMRDPIRDQDPLRDPIRDPIREPLRDHMRDPLRDPRDAYDMPRGLPPRERSPLRDPYEGPPRSRLPPRDRSPGRDLPPGEGPPRDRFDLRALPPPPREGSPLRDPYDDRFRDPYRGPRDPGRPPRDARDPYFNDPYRPPPAHDPYFDRFDTYRRDPFIDPYRDPYFPPPKLPPPPPPECVIVLMNNQLREYGERIERQIKALKVLTEVMVIPEGKPLIKQIEEISLQKGLYAIVLNSENQKHESLTLNVLFGKAQEHRNMPADCGVELIKKTFEKYLGSLKEKAAAPLNPGPPPPNPGPSGPPGNFTKPSKELSYLLHLLADSHHLTLGELDQVILYLKDRRDQELSPDSRPLGRIGPGLEKSLNSPGLIPTQLPPDPHQLPLRDSPLHLQTMRESPQGLRESPRQQLQLQESPKLQTQELQNNILGMLNGMNSGGVRPTPSSVPEPGGVAVGGAGGVGAMGGGMLPLTVSPQAPPVISPHVTPTSQSAAPTPISAAAINTALLNFDNPNVMMALDNLIQSGPNLLRNISAATSSAQPGPPGATNR